MPAEIPVICFVAARSGTGKTTFLEKLIREIVSRGYQVGAVKSDAHGFEIDKPGKDSWRFAQAGSKSTAIIGPDKFALIQQTPTKKELEEVVALMSDVDLILVEGYKVSDRPRIEIVRKELGTELVSPPEKLLAVITDVADLAVSVPIFALDDVIGVADFIIDKYF
ncbi:MAG: molybdopterin-guanine dinucleotide biosynthesis protein B [Peptococcaceae bacterium]|jgi:molybdopterin-guanine dinucleotide biosynthesis protein MobB|nr:molybdopterin-guanine dinucleotide biosynthesis protein B [Peptococcaceae bacterium]